MTTDIANQRRGLPLYATTEICSGGTYIVTGANVGLGFEASKHLVALGAAKVIMAVRNVSAGEAAKAKIEEATGTTNVAEVWVLDLASYDSVKAFAKKAETELERIDALIENAAVAMAGSTLPEGHLAPITVNVLSTLLLGVLLLPKMSDIARKFNIEPKITFVSSRVGFDAKADWDNVKDDPLRKIDSDGTLATKAYATPNTAAVTAFETGLTSFDLDIRYLNSWSLLPSASSQPSTLWLARESLSISSALVFARLN